MCKKIEPTITNSKSDLRFVPATKEESRKERERGKGQRRNHRWGVHDGDVQGAAGGVRSADTGRAGAGEGGEELLPAGERPTVHLLGDHQTTA